MGSEFLGLWESLHNPNFNRVQFNTFRTEAGLNRFVMTPSKWIELTGAIGITTKPGRTKSVYNIQRKTKIYPSLSDAFEHSGGEDEKDIKTSASVR